MCFAVGVHGRGSGGQDQQAVVLSQTSPNLAKGALANDQVRDDAAVVIARNQIRSTQEALASVQATLSQAQAQAIAAVQSVRDQAAAVSYDRTLASRI